MRTSLFPQLTGIRQIQDTVARNTTVYTVGSETSLRAAIAAAVSFAGVNGSAIGVTIIIEKSIVIQDPIVLSGCSGVRILGNGGTIRPGAAAIASAFDINSLLVTIENLNTGAGGASTDSFDVFASTSGGALVSSGAFILRCGGGSCDRLFVSTDSSDKHYVLYSTHTPVNGAHGASVIVTGVNCNIVGNTLDDGGGDSITISTDASDCYVSGNKCDGGDITTTASSGFNTIVGNNRMGAGSLFHASDATAGNS